MTAELTTVADDEAVVFDGVDVRHYIDLEPDTGYDFDGIAFTTLPRPRGELLCRFATVNDVHFGETVCGLMDGEGGPVFSSEPGADPYPEVMNRGAIAEIAAIDPAAVVVKGDLTAEGTEAEYERFLSFYEPAFRDLLYHVRGNHDAYYGGTFASDAPFVVDVPGARLAVLDTTIPGQENGQVSTEQLNWLADVASEAASVHAPVLVFGHHHAWDPSKQRAERYFGINPDDSERLIEVVARQPAIVGCFAGHTHRNRVRHFAATGEVPWVEVACVKDYPGSWAEYRVYEGGVLQVHRRISAPDALEWTEKTRNMFDGAYAWYALGDLADRCFPINFRPT
jgi:predicted phosphodiesterase